MQLLQLIMKALNGRVVCWAVDKKWIVIIEWKSVQNKVKVKRNWNSQIAQLGQEIRNFVRSDIFIDRVFGCWGRP